MTELIIRYAEPSGIVDKTVIPSEVVGELVRCKDCEYYKIPTQYRYTNSKLCCRSALQKVEEDDFCSWAKMKGGAE